MLYYLKNKYLSLAVNSFGASLESICYLGEERLWQGGEAWKSRDVVIFPIIGHAGAYTACGKEYMPKSHGVARYSEFALVDISVDKLVLELSSNPVTKRTYPYDFVFRVIYTLKKNTINVTYSVKSLGGEIPFYVGSHAGMIAPDGVVELEFENIEEPIQYLVDQNDAICWDTIKKMTVDKECLKRVKTLQLGNLSGGEIYARTRDGFTYTYKCDCPIVAIWSNENSGDYICVECWWGISDCPQLTRELCNKPFINFAGEQEKSFSYTLTISK